MAWHDDSHVISCNGTIIWEAVTKPDVKDSGGNSWNLRVAIDPNAPEHAELQELVQRALRNSKIATVSISNPGNNPISPIDQAKFPELPAHFVAFTAATTLGAPPVYDLGGAELQPMTYGPQLYNGSIVRLLVHAYEYDKKQKGINFGLDGVQIVDGKAPRLAIGAAGLSKDAVKSAFGGSSAPAAQTPTPAAPAPQAASTTPPPPPHTGYMGETAPPPPPAPAAAFPPAGWWPHPQAPGSFYNAQNEVLTEAQLRARG